MAHFAKDGVNAKRRAPGVICLLALLLTYAPIASATFMAVSGACCTGDQCPIHGNHHPAKESPSPKNESAPMDCSHEQHSANKMRSCSMSCCQNVESIAVHAHIFVLSPLPIESAFAPIAPAPIFAAFTNISLRSAPLAPPPKLISQ